MAPGYDDIEVGHELPAQTFTIRRADLVRYAGASGDFNVIHWNQRVAQSVGLPDVIAHGMFTMACVECKNRNYITKKNRRNDPDRMELKKFCPKCGKHTSHRETR